MRGLTRRKRTSKVDKDGASTRRITVLAARMRNGEHEAFEALYREFVAPLTRYVSVIVRNPSRVEDVVADIFVAVWEGRARLARPDRFEAWLFRIGHNQAVNAGRRKDSLPLAEGAEFVDPAQGQRPEAAFADRERLAAVREALDQLSDDQRTVLALRLFADMPSREIARRLGKSPTAVRALQYRALGTLARKLEDDDPARPAAGYPEESPSAKRSAAEQPMGLVRSADLRQNLPEPR